MASYGFVNVPAPYKSANCTATKRQEHLKADELFHPAVQSDPAGWVG
jgi:hypothetical protein